MRGTDRKRKMFCLLIWQIEQGEGVHIEELELAGKMDLRSCNLESKM